MSTTRNGRIRDSALADLNRWQMSAAVAAGRHADAIAVARRGSRGGGDLEVAVQEAEALLPLLRYGESLSATARALPRCTGGDPEARLRVVRAQGLFMTGRAGAGWSELRRATGLASSDHVLGLCAEAETLLYLREQRLNEAHASSRRAWHHYATCASPEGLGRVLQSEAAILRNTGAFDQALGVQGRRLEIASASTRLDLMAEARMDRGDLLAFLGRWNEASRDFDGAIRLFNELGDTRGPAVALPRRAMIDLARGDFAAVREALRKAREAEESVSSPWVLAEHALLASDLELAVGNHEAANGGAEEALSLFSLVRAPDGECRGRVRRTHALLGLGLGDRAVQEAQRAVHVAPGCRPDLEVLAALAEGRALLRLARETAAESFARARAAAGDWRGFKAAAELGLCLARGSGPTDAGIGRALAALEEWGDLRLLALVQSDLAALSGAKATATGVPASTVKEHFPEIVGRSPSMLSLFEQMTRAAASSLAVHIFGETGTGKEKVAQALHSHSSFAAGPFVAVNASSLSDELFEAEMFGHARGAFTGAVGERRGHVAEADGGTLFIDEVADLTPRGQAKLLRFLQAGEYRRVGETQTRRARVRVLSAANVRLSERVGERLFREDLLYRLAGLTLDVPPLRERGDDVVELARHLLRQAASREGRDCPGLGSEIVAELRRHSWPGNIRELENVINQLVVMAAGGPLRREQLAIASAGMRQRPDLRSGRAIFERELVARTLSQHGGNRTHAAAALGISRQALLLKIRSHRLD
jgi:DNA-binding NtrC family response regulator/tetratricopeptide (TPR) repeat protein